VREDAVNGAVPAEGVLRLGGQLELPAHHRALDEARHDAIFLVVPAQLAPPVGARVHFLDIGAAGQADDRLPPAARRLLGPLVLCHHPLLGAGALRDRAGFLPPAVGGGHPVVNAEPGQGHRDQRGRHDVLQPVEHHGTHHSFGQTNRPLGGPLTGRPLTGPKALHCSHRLARPFRPNETDHPGQASQRARPDAARAQGTAETLPCPGQPGQDRPPRTAQPPGRLGGGQPRPVTELHRQAILLRQPGHLAGNHVPQVVHLGRFPRREVRRRRKGAGLLPPQPPGHVLGDAIQPPPEGLRGADGGGTADQHEERGLGGIVDVRRRTQPAAAGGAHGRRVAEDDGLEGGLVAIGEEASEQFRIRASFLSEQREDGPEPRRKACARHDSS
jgi:hypothetical protein